MDSHHELDPHAPVLSRVATFQSLCLPEECLFGGTSVENRADSAVTRGHEIVSLIRKLHSFFCGKKNISWASWGGKQKPETIFKKMQFHKKKKIGKFTPQNMFHDKSRSWKHQQTVGAKGYRCLTVVDGKPSPFWMKKEEDSSHVGWNQRIQMDTVETIFPSTLYPLWNAHLRLS